LYFGEKKPPHFLKVAFNVSNQQQLLFQRPAIQTMPEQTNQF